MIVNALSNRTLKWDCVDLIGVISKSHGAAVPLNVSLIFVILSQQQKFKNVNPIYLKAKCDNLMSELDEIHKDWNKYLESLCGKYIKITKPFQVDYAYIERKTWEDSEVRCHILFTTHISGRLECAKDCTYYMGLRDIKSLEEISKNEFEKSLFNHIAEVKTW